MKTSSAGRAALMAREGRRLVAYRDSVGVLTIGVGHTGRMAPPPVTPGMRIDGAQCDAFLAADLGPIERVLNAAVKVPMTQNEFDALASLGFNIGEGGLRRSSVVKRLNLGDVRGAADAFLGWSKPAVLIGRRKAERAQFLEIDAVMAAKVLARRAAVLTRKAATAEADAKQSTMTAAAIGAMSAAVAVAQPVAAHHHGVLWVAFALGMAAAAWAVAIALLRHRKAATLSANADSQALAARSLREQGAQPD